MARKWIALFVIAMIVAGGFISTTANAKDAKGCEGLGEYRAEIFEVGSNYLTNVRSDIPGFDDREMTSYSSEEWIALADDLVEYQKSISAVEPPEWAKPWHLYQIERAGTNEQVARTAGTDGLFAIIAFTEAIEALESKAELVKSEVSAVCGDFPKFLADWDMLDGTMDQDSADQSTATEAAVKIGESATVDGSWEISVLGFFENAGEVEPTEKWFSTWIEANPAPTGEQIVAVKIRITNVGERAAYPRRDLSFDLVSSSGFEYIQSCGNPPNAIEYIDQLDSADSREGVFCWNVQTKHIASLKLRVKPSFSFDDSLTVWFDLTMDAVTSESNVTG